MRELNGLCTVCGAWSGSNNFDSTNPELVIPLNPILPPVCIVCVHVRVHVCVCVCRSRPVVYYHTNISNI